MSAVLPMCLPRSEHAQQLDRVSLALIGLLLAYVVLSLAYIKLPGVYYDEVILANQAFEILDGRLPLVGNVAYVGALLGYIHAPIVAVFGPSMLALRAVPVLLSCVSLYLLFCVTTALFSSRRAGLLAVVLFAFHPTLLFSLRNDDGPMSTMVLFELGCLFFLVKGAQSGKLSHWALSGLCAGLGFWQKAYFAWLAVALLVVLPFIWNDLRLSVRRAAAFGLCFLTGASPILWYNAMNNFPLLAGLVATKPRFDSLAAELFYFYTTLSGEAGLMWMTGRELPLPSMYPFLLLLSCLVALYGAPERRKRILLLVAVSGVILMQTIAHQKSGYAIRHYVLVYPLLAMLAAGACVRGDASAARTLNVCCFLTVCGNLIAIALYYKAIVDTGGTRVWSDAVYDLTSYRRSGRATRIIALDWGISEGVNYLMGDRAAIEQPSWTYADQQIPGTPRLFEPYCAGGIRFVSHTPQFTYFPAGRQVFGEILRVCEAEEVVEAELRQRDGTPVLIISKLKKNDSWRSLAGR